MCPSIIFLANFASMTRSLHPIFKYQFWMMDIQFYLLDDKLFLITISEKGPLAGQQTRWTFLDLTHKCLLWQVLHRVGHNMRMKKLLHKLNAKKDILISCWHGCSLSFCFCLHMQCAMHKRNCTFF